MQYETPSVLSVVSGDVLIVKLVKPGRLNAWDAAMRMRIAALLAESAERSEVKAVVLTGHGDRAFCAGADMQELSGHADAASIRAALLEWKCFYRAILTFRKPLVVALNGLAAGSAFQIALLADARVAHPGVTLGQTEIRWGIPSITGSAIMARRLGTALAAELALTGRMLDAAEAERHGLLSSVVPAPEVLPAAVGLARALGAHSPLAVAHTKRWFQEQELAEIERAFAFAQEAQADVVEHGDMSSRVAAFARTPHQANQPRTPE